MDDGGRPPYPSGSGEQRPQHSRPFFYVQPPSQPYYLYQHWQVQPPYNQYGMPGGYNFGRPCVQPYPYMQYPAFVVPQAPIHPLDYRRMFEPRFQSPSWNDAVRHQYPPQAQAHRETACSEAQTDPSDAITKLMECLDKLKANEPGGERELDSGVASQTSGLFSMQDEKKNEVQGTVHGLSSVATEVRGMQPRTLTYSNSATAVYEGNSSQRSLADLRPQVCWTMGFDEELPLDSSSVHEEIANQLAVDGSQFLPQRLPEKLRKGKIQSETPAVNIVALQSDGMRMCPNTPKCNTEEVKQNVGAFSPQLTCSSVSYPSTNQQVPADNKNADLLKAEYMEGAEADLSFQILKMPFQKSPTAGALLKDVAPLCGEVDTTLGSTRLLSSSSPVHPYCYSYLPTGHERMSVLSPSLDELSSRDEMFSTDLEDLDLFPQHVYGARRSSKVVGRSPPPAKGVRELFVSASKRSTCACCGKTLLKASRRNQVHSSNSYGTEMGDSDEDCRYRRSHEQHSRLAGKRHPASRRPQTPLPRPAFKLSCKRGQVIDPSSTQDPEEVLDLGEEDTADGEMDAMTGSDLQCRTCQDGLCREDASVPVQGRWGETEVKPRRKQTPLYRQEMTPLRKVPCKQSSYHTSRDEENDEDGSPGRFHVEKGTETTAATLQQNYGPGLHGAQPAQGLRQPCQGRSRAAQPEQQHHKPFFYIQPSHQPYLPLQGLQWPMPMPMTYNPYCGYPGLGYGVPMIPHYQPSPYMEPPGYVLPQTQLHLTDYRRVLGPQYYQTMAYHSRRFRYQHNGPAKEMVCSEVQTEPLMAARTSSSPVSSGGDASVSLPAGSKAEPEKNTTSTFAQPPPPALAVKGQRSPDLRALGSPPVRASPQSGFVIQTEEVRIECCSTPMGLKVLHAHEAAALSRGFPREVSHCTSVQEEHMCLAAEQSEQCLNVCPDILLVGTLPCGNGEELPSFEDPQTEAVGVALDTGPGPAVCGEALVTGYKEDPGVNQARDSVGFNVLQLSSSSLRPPEELVKTPESAAWSLDDTCGPAADWLSQSDPPGPQSETLLTLPSEMSSIREVMVEEGLPMEEETPTVEVPPSLEDLTAEAVPMAEDPVVKVVPGAESCYATDAALLDFTSTSEVSHTPEASLTTSSPPEAKSPVSSDAGRQRGEPDDQDTSFESLPAYLPSNSRLADLGDVHHSSKLPWTPQKQTKPVGRRRLDVPSRRRRLELDAAKLRAERCQADRPGLSDRCLDQNFNENLFSPAGARGMRLCAKCLVKRSVHISAGLGPDRRPAPFRPWADVLLATCETCKSHSKKRAVNGSSSDLASLCPDEDVGELSENACGRMGTNGRSRVGLRKLAEPKKPLAPVSQGGKSPVVARCPKLREKNCTCEERPPAVGVRHIYVGAIRETNDENFSAPAPLQEKWRNMDQRCMTQKWQTEKLWKAGLPDSGTEGSKNGATSQHLSKRRRSQLYSPGIHRKDTRC